MVSIAAIPIHAMARERRERTAGCRRPRWRACAARCARPSAAIQAMTCTTRQDSGAGTHAVRLTAPPTRSATLRTRSRMPLAAASRIAGLSYDSGRGARLPSRNRPSGALARARAWLTRRRRRLRRPLRLRLPRPRPPEPRAPPRPRPQRSRRRVLRAAAPPRRVRSRARPAAAAPMRGAERMRPRCAGCCACRAGRAPRARGEGVH